MGASGLPDVLFYAVAADELVEPALGAVTCALLVEERQAVLVKLAEEVLPGDRLQLAFAAVAREVETQDAGVVLLAGALHAAWLAAALFGPTANELVIGSGLARHDPTWRRTTRARRPGCWRPQLIAEAPSRCMPVVS